MPFLGHTIDKHFILFDHFIKRGPAVKKQSRFFRHDVIMSAITLLIVGGLVYTGVSALKENEISPLQRELRIK